MGERTPPLKNASFKLTLYGCVASVCCVVLASFDVVCDELHVCAWNVGPYQLSDWCVYVYCVESFALIEGYSDCSCRGAMWLNHFDTVLFNVCGAVYVECCVLYSCCVGVFCMVSVI